MRPQSDATVFQAIACPTRRALLDALTQGERNVSALVDQLDVTQSAVSQQLLVLKNAGLVAERQQGRFRFYQLRTQGLTEVEEWVARHRALVERQLDMLGQVLDQMPPRSREAATRKGKRSPAGAAPTRRR